MKEPWPDFLTFYATATGAGWIVPKRYVEEVGQDGFKLEGLPAFLLFALIAVYFVVGSKYRA